MEGACSTHVRLEIHIKFLSENLKGRNHSEGPGTGGRIILEWILGKEGGRVWTGFPDSSDCGYGQVAGSCEHDNNVRVP
jgi:hypothetical protein